MSLIQGETWPGKRKGAEEWQRNIIDQFKQSNATEDHIEEIKPDIGSIRYRPEDVAGAGAAENLPAPFEPAKPLAKIILKKLKDNNPYS